MRFLFNIFICSVFFSCTHNTNSVDVQASDKYFNQTVYLNHSDSAKYVGKQTCALCHQDIYNTFIQTGMGKSMRIAQKKFSAANFNHAVIKDEFSHLSYTMFLIHDSLYMKEYYLHNSDTDFQFIRKINYIIGSGQHTNSHLYNINGYVYQAPMTFYVQKQVWDLPPGFENGNNTRFSRKIGAECMTCHNAYPEITMGSENKYRFVPDGIDCERCHGPGSIHVNKIKNGNITDTLKDIDYSIVNPAKLSIEKQFDVCMRCHLQGNTVLKKDYTFFDFKPGMNLKDFMDVFLPRYSDSKENFIMASHADRLKQSQCFIKSFNHVKQNALKPYTNALTCVTCHNPHISVKTISHEHFIQTCLKCHHTPNKECTNKAYLSAKKSNHLNQSTDCITCHMPTSGSADIPHVSIHDHYIHIPKKNPSSKKEIKKTFLGLQAINDSLPDKNTKALAYIYQYEKFDAHEYYLDSAEKTLNASSINDIKTYFTTLIHLYFCKKDYIRIIKIVQNIGATEVLNTILNKTSYNNTHAWASYRIGEAYYQAKQYKEAELFYNKSVNLAPYILDFRNKLAVTQMINQKIGFAYQNWRFILKENPFFVPAYSNLGYAKMIINEPDSAWYYYQKGLRYDLFNEPLLMNVVAYFMQQKNTLKAKEYLLIILKQNPNHAQAKQLYEFINKKDF